MFSFLRRHMITVAYLKPGIERRATISLLPALAVVAALIALPAVIAFAAAWKANDVVQGLNARHRALEIETANYRAALEALVGQLAPQQSTLPDAGAAVAGTSESDQLVETPTRRSTPASLSVPLSGPAAVAASDALQSPDNPAPPAPPNPAPALEANAPAPVAPIQPTAAAGDRSADTEPAWRAAIKEALARLNQARISAEAAEGPALASESYRAGVSLELEAQELSAAGRMNDALVRAVEADARFRAAEIEARAQASAWERMTLGDAPTPPVRPSLAEMRGAAAEPAESPGESRQVVRTAMPIGTDLEGTIRDVIAQYVKGLESRNLATLKRVWPSLGGSQERAIQTEFENARTVQTLFTDPRITIDGDITTVTGFRMHSLVTHDGQRLSSVTRTTMTLRRNGDEWVIERVVHQQ